MSDSAVVEFHNVSKLFALQRTRGARSFQETLIGLFRRRAGSRRFWGLRDVSFSLEKGKTVGFVGANGAGKSTALKLIARILEPTSGSVHVNGRVGALLELGAGFHPDLSGRENIFLNGALLGFHRDYLKARLDEIISFAELEDFIDAPVKHYSSGMYVRLGFALAVHMDPEILLVDEVLAVGDSRFQHKCLSRIAELRRSGVSIVLVSHDLDTIQAQCDEVLWFDHGNLMAHGPTVDVVMSYIRYVAQRDGALVGGDDAGADDDGLPVADETEGLFIAASEPSDARWGSGKVRITRVEFRDKDGRRVRSFMTGEPMTVHLHYQARTTVEKPVFGLAVHSQNGTHICGPNSGFGKLHIDRLAEAGCVTYHVGALPLLPGGYYLSVSVHDTNDLEMYDYHDRLYPLRIYPGDVLERYGLLALGGTWSHSEATAAQDHT